MTIAEQKKLLRNEIRVLKGLIGPEEKKSRSQRIFGQLAALEIFINSKTIMFYWSMDDEVHTHDTILQWHGLKKIILPSVKGEILLLKEFCGLQKLIPGEGFGIPEPDGPLFEKPEEIDLIVVPGIAFDKSNNRMGRGKAYYDRLLKNSDAIKVGVCFDFQLRDQVPVDEFDVKMDVVLSDQ